jgi:trimethylamine--corrinoid protein Co-methyltransferase
VLDLLADHGARVDQPTDRAVLTHRILDHALATVAHGFRLYDTRGETPHDLSGDHLHFTPGSAAIAILDHEAHATRPPTTADYVRYAKVTAQLGP